MGQSVSDGIRPKIAKASLDYDRLLLGQSSHEIGCSITSVANY